MFGADQGFSLLTCFGLFIGETWETLAISVWCLQSSTPVNHTLGLISNSLLQFWSYELCDVINTVPLWCGSVYDLGLCSDPHAVGHMVNEKDWSCWLHIYWQFRISCTFGTCSFQPLLVVFFAPHHIIYCSARFFFSNPKSCILLCNNHSMLHYIVSQSSLVKEVRHNCPADAA